MNTESELNYFGPILSALAGIGTILAPLSPVFNQTNFVRNIFIDQGVVLRY